MDGTKDIAIQNKNHVSTDSTVDHSLEVTMKILETVNQFYTDSFDQLIYITLAFLAFVGVLLPVLISIYQRKMFELDSKKIQNVVEDYIDKSIAVHIDKLTAELELKKLEIKQEISDFKSISDKRIDRAMGSIFHVQARAFSKDSNFIISIDSYITSATHYLRAKSGDNLLRVIRVLNNQLSNIDKDDIDSAPDVFDSLEPFLEELKKNDENNVYRDHINDIRRSYKKALSR